MPCHAAMIENPPMVPSSHTVEDALAVMTERGSSFVIVVNDQKQPVGVFSYKSLIENALPVSVAMDGGANMDITVRAAPGMAKRLRKLDPLAVFEIAQRRFPVVYPDTPTWEGVNLLALQGDPVVVIDRETGTLRGAITYASALGELQRLKQG